MPSYPPNMIFDGFSSQSGGMNNGRDASLLGPHELHLLVNGTIRGDFIRQRPGFKRIMQVLPAGSGRYQHTGWLRQRNGRVLLAMVVDGRFYRIDPLIQTVAEFTIAGNPNAGSLMQGWSIPGGAEGFWIYQDGSSRPLIWTGGTARRAGFNEIKTGRVMAYVQGRIWYALPDALSFRAGDLVGNEESGTQAYAFKDSILRETENTYLNEGGDFSVPVTVGEIRGMAATAVLDTSQGQGPLQVFAEKGAFSVNTPVDREIWKLVRYPIQTTSLLGSGYLSAQATINVGGDIFGRAHDGIRSFIVARRNFRDWGNTPQSFEVSNILRYDQEDLLPFSSAAVFDNRMLMTVSPRWSEVGVPHRGLVVLDLAPVSSIRTQGVPHYEGIWTGLQILAITQTDIGTYLTVLAGDGSIDLWALTKEDLYDADVGRVEWSVVPRRMFVERDQAQRPFWNLKRLETADLFYDELAGAVDFSMYWRPDAYPCDTLWRRWEECAPVCTTAPGCTPPKSFKRQYKPRTRLPSPPEVCVEGTGSPLRMFYELNTRLDVIGPARLRGVRIGAVPQPEPAFAPNCDPPTCTPITCCDFDPFTYVATASGGDTTYGYGGSGGGGGGGGGTGGTIDDPNTGTDDGGTGGLDDPPGTDEPTTEEPPPNTTPELTGPDWPFVSLGDGAQTFQPFFEDDEGNLRPIGYGPTGFPPSELDEGILEQWKAAVAAKWSEYWNANDLDVRDAQMFWQDSPGDTQLRYHPNGYFNGIYNTAAWHTEIFVEFVLND